MLQPKCDVCGEPARIHETAVEAGGAVTRHLCQTHWKAALPPIKLGPDAAAAAEEQFRNLSDAEKEHFALTYRLTRRGV